MIARGLRPPAPRGAEHERAALLAAIAHDRAQLRRRETAWHVALIMLLFAVALPILGVGLAKLLLSLRLL